MKSDSNDEPEAGNPSARYPGGESFLPGPSEGAIERTIRDYVLILRERVWYVVAVFVIVFSAALVFTFSSMRLYTAGATVEVLRSDPVVMKVQEVRDSELRGPEDLLTHLRVFESSTITEKVADRLTPEETKTFMAPYEKGRNSDPLTPASVLFENRKVNPIRMTRLIQVTYSHPDPELAARIANLFVEEFTNYNSRWRMDESLKAVEDLKVRADQQTKKVHELATNLHAYKESNNMVSLDQRKDIVTEKLKALNLEVTRATTQMKQSEIRRNQMQEYRDRKADLTELEFIASLPLVQDLLRQEASQKVLVAQLAQRYKFKHPKMLEAVQSLTQTQTELQHALDSAATKIGNEYESSRRQQEQARADLAAQETEALKVDRLSVDYQSVEDELHVNEQLLATIMGRMRETTMSAAIETQNSRVVDRARRPIEASSPKVALNLGIGAFAGLVLGLVFALIIANLDDRVKSSYDVESVIGLPLLGVVPRISKQDALAKAQIASNGADPFAAEAFLTIHSNLRLHHPGRDAQVLLVTSSMPGEGKSFISSNLALTLAAHGEKTILVDCDLRKPNVHRSLGVENRNGVIDFCLKNTPLAGLIVTAIARNLDVLPAGGRAQNPTQILNSDRFESLLTELRQRYDRIILDTPPLAAVSDALIVLPFVDGSIFAVHFNKVPRKAAQHSARRLQETEVPCVGAVLNGVNPSQSGYYYGEYCDKAFKEYHRPVEGAGKAPYVA